MPIREACLGVSCTWDTHQKVTPEPRVLLTRRTKREHNDSNEIRYLRPSVLTKGSWRVGAGRGTVVAQRKGARARVLLLPARTRGCQLALPSHLLPRVSSQ
eukprot:1603776-Rhodomonas_salina.2